MFHGRHSTLYTSSLDDRSSISKKTMLPIVGHAAAGSSIGQLVIRGGAVSLRLLTNLASNQQPGATRPVGPLPKDSSSAAVSSPTQQNSEQQQPEQNQVLGVLTSLLQQQQQQHQGSSSLEAACQAQEGHVRSSQQHLQQHLAQHEAMAQQWQPQLQQQQQQQQQQQPSASSQIPLPSPRCLPESELAAATSSVRMDSQVLFDSCWRKFRERRGMDFAAPREIVWLNGAPGSGKGVSAPHIRKVRGMTKSICVSSLLGQSPEAQRYISAGEMISDATVGDLLLEELLQPASVGVSTADLNAVVDGFPRTAVQVDFVKLLMDKLMRLHRKYVDTPLAAQFPRPAFKVVVLYVDEATSIQRQLQRAVAARAHNARLNDAGVGGDARLLQEERPTDLDLNKATKRYQIFKQHYSAILRLKQFLPFHLIDAMSSKQETLEQITQELRYQSSLDLSEEAYNAIRHLPLAKDLQQTARQQLVGRLEHYCLQQRPLFGRVLDILQRQVLPLLQQGALAGSAEWLSTEPLFAQHPVCIDMLLDVLSDRGFKATYCREGLLVPVAIDAASGHITVRSQPQHRFRFWLEQAGEREASMLKALEIAARITEAARGNMVAAAQSMGAAASQQQQHPHSSSSSSQHHSHLESVLLQPHQQPLPTTRVTESFIPEHLDHERKARRGEDMRRVTLTALTRRPLYAAADDDGGGGVVAGASAAAAAAAAACAAGGGGSGVSSTAATAGSCGSCTGSGEGSGSAGGGVDVDDGGVLVLHRCLRPDVNCGHAGRSRSQSQPAAEHTHL